MTRSDKAKYLFEKMELIDDAYIDEAASYRPRSGRILKKASVIIAFAAVLSLFILLGMGSLFFRDHSKKGLSDTAEKYYAAALFDQVSENHTPHNSEAELLSSVMSDGCSHLIWMSVESGKYYDVKINASQESRLLGLSAYGTPITESSENGSYRVWIKRQDGTVISPELKRSVGNIYYGTVFEYDPELALSDEFVKSLESILY